MGATTQVSWLWLQTKEKAAGEAPPALTDGQERVLQLQGESGQGDVF